FFQAEDGIRDDLVTGVQTCALPIWMQPILERRYDAEVRACASDTPVEVIVLVSIHGQDPAIGGDDHGREDVIARQAVLAVQPPRSEERRVGKECSSRW